jgi:DNA-binding transcriptional LysR family regulator
MVCVAADRQHQRKSGSAFRNVPPLHCLLAFEAAARNLSLAKAAAELRLTGPAVAQSISMLEDRLALKLVRSTSPTLELTAAGERYFHSVQVFTHRLRDGVYERFPSGRTQLRVTASQALARLWLAPRMASFSARHPRIEVFLNCTEQFQPIKAGGVDIGLRYGGAVDEDLVVIPLWTDRLVAAGSPVLAARSEGLSPAEISRALPLIDHPAAGWRQWLGALEAPLAPPCPWLTCTDLHLAIEAACQGLGLVVAPARILAGKLARGSLRVVSTHSAPAKAYQAVLWREQAERPPLMAFVEWLQEQVSAAPGPSGAGRKAAPLARAVGST